nr:hypothetical protein [Tanacetum cinerariifolium]
MLITMLRKDMMVLEQKVIHLTRLRRPSSYKSSSSSKKLPTLTPLTWTLERRPNLLVDLATSLCCSLDLAVGFCLLRIGAWSSSLLMLFNMGARCFFLVEESESSDGLVVLYMSYIRLSDITGSFFELELDFEDDGLLSLMR